VTIPAYPLSWPAGWKRMPASHRANGKFGKQTREHRTWNDGSSTSWTRKGEISIAGAVERIRDELRRMGVPDDDLVISTNLQLRLDGFPKSAQRQPEDPGVAVYWRDGADTRCMAIDRYHLVEHNLAAVAATLDAMRAIERHGGAEILNRAFAGFAALPGPGANDPEWWEVLEVDESCRGMGVVGNYRVLRSQHHPDKGGDPHRFAQIQRAYERACELGHC
jgi:hypothetical protein